MQTATQTVAELLENAIPSPTPVALVTGQHLTAQGLADKIKAVQSDLGEAGKTKMQWVLADLVNFPLTGGLDLIRETRKIVTGGKETKEQTPTEKALAKRTSEIKSVFACLKLVHDSKPEAFNGMGWNTAYAYSVKALESKGLTANGGEYKSPEQRKLDKEANLRGATIAEAVKRLGTDAPMDAVIAEAAKVREEVLLNIDAANAPDALLKLGKLLQGAIPAAEVLIRGEPFRSTMHEGLENADYWRAQIEEWKRIVRFASQYAMEKADAEKAAAGIQKAA